jgi:hypothetical protein
MLCYVMLLAHGWLACLCVCLCVHHSVCLWQGIVPEFVNPKYDPTTHLFKSPTRVECMMQVRVVCGVGV